MGGGGGERGEGDKGIIQIYVVWVLTDHCIEMCRVEKKCICVCPGRSYLDGEGVKSMMVCRGKRREIRTSRGRSYRPGEKRIITYIPPHLDRGFKVPPPTGGGWEGVERPSDQGWERMGNLEKNINWIRSIHREMGEAKQRK